MTRKEKSEAKLNQLGIPINPFLPNIESREEANFRSAEEVARRAEALLAVAITAKGFDRAEVIEWLQSLGTWECVTPEEEAFLTNRDQSDKDNRNFSWRVESLWVLLWALGKVEKLNFPSTLCDIDFAYEAVTKASDFVAAAQLRDEEEILDEADLIYRIHWAGRDAELRGEDPPCELHPGIVYERHYALNWLIGYMDQDWDDVTTDT